MECPNCRLFNPPEAVACDCGFSFVKANDGDYKTEEELVTERRARGASKMRGAILLCAIAGIATGVAVFMLTAFTLNNGLVSERTAGRIATLGIILVMTSIVAGVLSAILLFLKGLRDRSGL
jgi:hypothetical protein